MELRTGYKQTEVGTIPEDWQVSKLRNYCSKITDGTHDTPTPVRSGVPFLTAVHVKDGWIDYQSCLYVTEEVHKVIFSRCNPEKNDVLMVNIGAGVATTALVNVDYEFSLKNVALLKPNARWAVGSYLNYTLTQRKSKIVRDLSSGGAQPFLSLNQIGDIEAPFPPTKAEQEAIAEALSDADALIESLEQLIAKKRLIKQGTMQELLSGKRRLPGFEKKRGYRQTEVGTIPQDWHLVEAGSIGRFKGGSGFPIVYQGNGRGEYPFFKVSDMNNEGNETFMEKANNYISETIRKRLNAYAFPARTIVFAKVGAAVFLERKKILTKPACIDNNMAGFIVSFDNADHRYIHYYLLAFRLGSLVSTTALPSLSGSVLNGIKISLPPTKAEQEAIASILTDMDAELAALETKLAKYRQIKQGMMQELLTGRIRLA